MSSGKDEKVDFVVVGSGIAGLRAAVELAQAGRALVLTKGEFLEGDPHYAQGGIAAAIAEDDEITLRFHDTVRAGDGLCREDAVRALVDEGLRQIQELIQWGVRFNRNSAKLAFTSESAHSRSRVLRAEGTSTSGEVLRALMARARSLPNLELRAHAFPMEFLKDEDRVGGLMYLDERSASFKRVHSSAVLLATGGLGQIYRETTNPPAACGDGVALAWRAGALLSDMEFIQFHPTSLSVRGAPGFLLPEALRGEGAHLRNVDLERFMPRYHEAGELAPRDVLCRAIVMEMQKCRSDFVYLDLTRLNGEHLKKRFSRIYDACLEHSVDITTDFVPVRPAAHFAIGGVATDLYGATSLPGLYAAGEVASTGVHGASCLPSNSLLEELVYGARAASAVLQRSPPFSPPRGPQASKAQEGPPGRTSHGAQSSTAVFAAPLDQVRSLMWEKVGIIRRGKELNEANRSLEMLSVGEPTRPSREYYEQQNILAVALLVVRSARAREESRGVHYRADFPLKRGLTGRHSFVSRNLPVYFA